MKQQLMTNIKNAQKPNARPPVRKTDVAKKETEFVQLRTLFRTKVVRFKDYFKLILNLYQFYPKKKYVEPLHDTDVFLIPKTMKLMIQVMRLMILMMSLLMNQSMK